jgi:glucose/arabinose dehydrogenase
MRRPAAAALAVAVVLVPSAGGAAERVHVPHGFRVDVFARGLTHPTAMAWGPEGRLYATEDVGSLVSTTRGSTRPHVVASGLRTPLGLAWWGRTVFVSERGRLERLRVSADRVVARRTIVSGLPYGRHQQDNVVVGRDRRLYFGSGSTCDVCRERDRRSAAILSVRMDGRDLRIVARGLRNPYGLAFQPRTSRLYTSVNGQDELGSPRDPEPAEMVVRVRGGRWYGWPRCWPNARLQRMSGRCRGVTAPAAYLEPHASADGIVFYGARSFGRRYRGNLFVAEWGQYSSHRFGRRLVRVVLADSGDASRVSTFADGFDHPLALALDRHGALLVADWGRGVIYRIQRRGRP